MVKDIINNQNITIMAYYVKCNDKTYQYIGAPTERVALEDGNHLAWQADFSKFPEWPDLRTIAAKTGSLLLSPSEARDEQDGVTCRELPEATEEMFRVAKEVPEEESEETPEVVPETEVTETPEAPTEPSDKSAQSDKSDTPANEEGVSE